VFLEHGWLTNILGPHLAKIGHKNLGQKKINLPARPPEPAVRPFRHPLECYAKRSEGEVGNLKYVFFVYFEIELVTMI
jgi:hypothetical protein